MADRLQRPRRGPLGLGILALTIAAPSHAQVIEIGDDGEARIYAKPTLFLGGDAKQNTVAASARPLASDRFERAAKSEGVDVNLLRAVAWTESRGRQSAVSPKGALGIMQLMPGTAAELRVDPRDPDSNVSGGARYLARQLARFQSVPLALAAYNAGPGAVLRWRGIPPYAETRSYVAQVMSRYNGLALPVGTAKPVARAAAPLTPFMIEVPSL